ncbi:unnamed protein product [Polarella glacialis]|uniref:Uncharacterized protein n=1 Tax=Polarella glacialis TaxID=89957 RepID=A0A813DGM6_POLGL|nr:unnamed protein product [Polarella glacialis]
MPNSPPPAALLAFLGEAPSEAALRRPTSSASTRPANRRSRGEDSSPDTPGVPRADEFDDFQEYSGATAAQSDRLGSDVPTAGSGRSQSQRAPALPPRGSRTAAEAGYAVPAASPPRPQPANSKRTVSRQPEVEDMNKTTTPMPGGLASFLGEEPTAAASRRSEPVAGSAPTQRPQGSGGSGRSSDGSRPRSGSHSRLSNGSGRDGSNTPSREISTKLAALDVKDPLGSANGKKSRFGGRG